MEESYQRWLEPPEAISPLESVTVASFPNGMAVLLVAAGEGSFVKLTFQCTTAVTVHDETTHPLVDRQVALPRLSGGGAYPYLKVVNSAWAASLSDVRREMNEAPPAHYLVLTFNNYVDVLSYARPEIELLGPDAWEHLFGRLVP